MDNIREGKFLPDESRSGMWLSESQPSASAGFMIPTAKALGVPRPEQTDQANREFLARQSLDRIAEAVLASNVELVENGQAEVSCQAKPDDVGKLSESSDESSSDEDRGQLNLRSEISFAKPCTECRRRLVMLA